MENQNNDKKKILPNVSVIEALLFFSSAHQYFMEEFGMWFHCKARIMKELLVKDVDTSKRYWLRNFATKIDSSSHNTYRCLCQLESAGLIAWKKDRVGWSKKIKKKINERYIQFHHESEKYLQLEMRKSRSISHENLIRLNILQATREEALKRGNKK